MTLPEFPAPKRPTAAQQASRGTPHGASVAHPEALPPGGRILPEIRPDQCQELRLRPVWISRPGADPGAR